MDSIDQQQDSAEALLDELRRLNMVRKIEGDPEEEYRETLYEYDAMNRLRAIVLPDGSRREYVYDASTRRLASVILNDEGVVLDTETHAYGPGWETLADLDEELAPKRLYVSPSGMDAQVAMIGITGEEAATYYYLRDHLGSVLALVDGATGEIIESYEYEPYGMPTITAIDGTNTNVVAESSAGNRFLYTGREWDAEAELYHYRFRSYSPREHRFMQSDPIGLGGGWNHFAYVGGNPMSLNDKLGLDGILTIHSSGATMSEGLLMSGHSWIEWTPIGSGHHRVLSDHHTYGTWGNLNPKGLYRDIELTRNSEASRSQYVNDEGEQALLDVLKKYNDLNEKGWKYLTPCSAFAEEAWEEATGEDIKDNHPLLQYSNPVTLRNSINKLNGGIAHNTTPQQLYHQMTNWSIYE